MADTPVEQRAADQDTAQKDAFLAGTLPDEDRRVVVAPVVLAEPAEETVATADPVVADAETAVGTVSLIATVIEDVLDLIRRAKGETGYTQTALLTQAHATLSATLPVVAPVVAPPVTS